MPNIDAVKGAFPVMHLDGSPYTGKTNMYLVPSGDGTALFVGDFVKRGGSAGAAGTVVNGQDVEGMPTVIQAAATDTLLVGVVVGFLPNQDNLSLKYRVASTNRIALVADAPDLVFEIQEDSVGGALSADEVGENADITVAAGNTTTGLSGMELDSSDHKTATAQLRILGLVKKPDNAIGTNAKWLVMINEHAYKTTTGV
jgi:hypothetical protein